MVNYAKGGKPYWVEIHLEPIHNIDGRLTGFISVERDVTKDELHQHEIGELSAAMYETLVQKVAPKSAGNIRLNSSKNKRQPSAKSNIAKRNRGKKLFKKGSLQRMEKH